MTGRLFTVEDIALRQPDPSDTPDPPYPEDEGDQQRAFLARDHELTDRIRIAHGMEPLYTEAGACCEWRAR